MNFRMFTEAVALAWRWGQYQTIFEAFNVALHDPLWDDLILYSPPGFDLWCGCTFFLN